MNENLDTDGLIQAFLENLKVEKMANMTTAASSYGDKVKACGVHFSKLPQHRCDEVSELIAVALRLPWRLSALKSTFSSTLSREYFPVRREIQKISTANWSGRT